MMIFLKLGGSLITNKDIPFSPRKETIKRLGEEIAQAMDKNIDLKLLIGHGSGSFGHAVAHQFGTREGIHSDKDWIGFQQVWSAAHQLNQIVIDIFSEIGLPVLSFPPSASLISKGHKIEKWVIEPIVTSIENKLIPIVFGDVVIDQETGATIFSTEELFSFLASKTHPDQILLAGIEGGVYMDYPKCQDLIPSITTASYPLISKYITTSSSTDVTGGMASKVKNMLEIIQANKKITIHIFSGENKDNLFRELSGNNTGTLISH
ncbi:MAG: isopentenyl phosphate kinase [Pelolinea sp.]|nr:isopentenyl phosphate kinase [Pelolinea sp.]